MENNVLTPSLADAMVRVTEVAAIAASKLVGRGDEKKADAAAVDAMRTAFNQVDFQGRVVIGEGERDEAPMLYIGEEVGTGKGPAIDIALDPLEGTTLTAKAMANALAVLAIAPKGGLLHAPDTYMDKIAIGPGYPEGIVSLEASPAENITALAKHKGVEVSDMTACVLDRPRHEDIIESLRSAGARVALITDGDVAGVIATTNPHTGIDLYLGSGGAPEGVLAAAAAATTPSPSAKSPSRRSLPRSGGSHDSDDSGVGSLVVDANGNAVQTDSPSLGGHLSELTLDDSGRKVPALSSQTSQPSLFSI
jgi:fructose-1,6-bisphosphatase II / sedoheptulose-1,7-bisphosphatase